MLKLRSVSSIVIAPAKTVSLVTRKTSVTAKAQSIRGRRSRDTSFAVREQIIVDR